MEKSQTLDSGAIEEKIREVAIPVSDDLVMVPAGLDEDSCEMFKPYSANNPVKAAIHYRQADGSFDIGKDLAVCQVEMAPMGPGDDGCERYQAKPVNGGQAGDHAVTYYKKADGTYSAYKPGDSCS